MHAERESCPECAGDCELETTGESGLQMMTRLKREIAGHFSYARKALSFAKRYAVEARAAGQEPRNDHRFVECVARVADLRRAIIAARAELAAPGPDRGMWAWCIACRGTGFADIACEGCGEPVSGDDTNDLALENADILVHKGCDTGHAFFDNDDRFDPPPFPAHLYSMGWR